MVPIIRSSIFIVALVVRGLQSFATKQVGVELEFPPEKKSLSFLPELLKQQLKPGLVLGLGLLQHQLGSVNSVSPHFRAMGGGS